MYSPTQGRFISTDPIGFQAGDANLYRFVGNTPTNATDPSGLVAELIGAFAPLFFTGADEPKKLPTSATLSWNDYPKIKAGKYDAWTAGNIFWNYGDIKTTSKAEGCGFVGTATLAPRYRAVFNPEDSYLVTGRQTASLLKHERLHLAIAEYIAEKAFRNLPEKDKMASAIGKGDTAEVAMERASTNLQKVLDTKLGPAREALAAITKQYDDDTTHGGVPAAQADWGKNYMNKIDEYVKTQLKWEK